MRRFNGGNLDGSDLYIDLIKASQRSERSSGIFLGWIQWSAALISIVCVISVGAPAFAKPPAKLARADNLQIQAQAIFAPLPDRVVREGSPITDAEIRLGKRLYSDTILSIDRDISCNSCHDLERYGVDGEKTSPGHRGQRGERNSPTSFNAALHIAQFWDGRAKTLEEQALGPVTNPVEMAMPTSTEVVKRLKDEGGYTELFKEAFPDRKGEITFELIGQAIGAFERTLVTPSRFDNYLKGDSTALTEKEKAGLKVFMGVGCTACHAGVAIGGAMYQKIGLVNPYETKDLGRYNVTKNESDKYFFKVPSLRNIEKTAPYFHNGEVATLEEAVKLMAYHQLGRELPKEEVEAIISFLKSLTGELPEGVVD